VWAQVQRVRSHPDHEGEVLEVFERLREIEQDDSGLVQTLVLRSQSDPSDVFVVVVMESEEKARAREQDPRREEGLQGIRSLLGGILEGPPEFFDRDVVLDR
jgi:heme-degrading monooxygenase HmoA